MDTQKSYEFAPAWVARVLDISEAEARRVIARAYESEYFYERMIDGLQEFTDGAADI